MSRQELADAVNVCLFTMTGQVSMLSANYIGKSERGVPRWPRAAYRRVFCAVLGAELGFCIVRRTDNPIAGQMLPAEPASTPERCRSGTGPSSPGTSWAPPAATVLRRGGQPRPAPRRPGGAASSGGHERTDDDRVG